MSEQDIKGFLMGGGVAAKFPKIGYQIEGTVTSFRMQQQRDYDTGELLFWKDGNKRMQLLIVMDTEEQGSFDENGEPVEVPDDDGQRTLYVKGALQKAIGRALKEAGAELEEGGYLKVKRVKDLPKTNPKFKAPYGFAVQYTPAAKNSKAATDFAKSDPETGAKASGKDDDPWAE